MGMAEYGHRPSFAGKPFGKGRVLADLRCEDLCRPVPLLIGQEVFHRSQQKRPEPAAMPVGAGQVVLGQQADEKLLGQVLGIFWGVAGAAHERIERKPVVLTQRGQCPARVGRMGTAGACDHAPMRGGKPVPACRESFEFTISPRHSPNLTANASSSQ
jgi:hypothetical protein